MPTVIVRQPNGKLAAFSSVSEDFSAWDMTEDEAVDFCREHLDLGVADSRRKVTAGIEDHIPYTTKPGDGRERWTDALRTMALNKDRATVRSRLDEMGFSEQSIDDLEFPSEDDVPTA